jgi:hypothetical protein
MLATVTVDSNRGVLGFCDRHRGRAEWGGIWWRNGVGGDICRWDESGSQPCGVVLGRALLDNWRAALDEGGYGSDDCNWTSWICGWGNRCRCWWWWRRHS